MMQLMACSGRGTADGRIGSSARPHSRWLPIQQAQAASLSLGRPLGHHYALPRPPGSPSGTPVGRPAVVRATAYESILPARERQRQPQTETGGSGGGGSGWGGGGGRGSGGGGGSKPPLGGNDGEAGDDADGSGGGEDLVGNPFQRCLLRPAW